MKASTRPTRRSAIRYILLQVPGTLLLVFGLELLRHFFEFPAWIVWAGAGIWAAKDAALFPFLWRAYEPRSDTISDILRGREGIVIQRLEPNGAVRVRGERWRARTDSGKAAEIGTRIRIEQVEGLTLIVSSVEDTARDSGPQVPEREA